MTGQVDHQAGLVGFGVVGEDRVAGMPGEAADEVQGGATGGAVTGDCAGVVTGAATGTATGTGNDSDAFCGGDVTQDDSSSMVAIAASVKLKR